MRGARARSIEGDDVDDLLNRAKAKHAEVKAAAAAPPAPATPPPAAATDAGAAPATPASSAPPAPSNAPAASAPAAATTDAVRDPDDRMPALVDAASWLRHFAKHPDAPRAAHLPERLRGAVARKKLVVREPALGTISARSSGSTT